MLRHTGEYSDYECDFLGIFETYEQAEEQIQMLLHYQVSLFAARLKDEATDYPVQTRDERRRKKHLLYKVQLINDGKYDIKREASNFEIVESTVGKMKDYKPFERSNKISYHNTIYDSSNPDQLNKRWHFETDIFKGQPTLENNDYTLEDNIEFTTTWTGSTQGIALGHSC